MKPFDPSATCPKCKHDVILVRYTRVPEVGFMEEEWLTRICNRCNYWWSEDCLDDERVENVSSSGE